MPAEVPEASLPAEPAVDEHVEAVDAEERRVTLAAGEDIDGRVAEKGKGSSMDGSGVKPITIKLSSRYVFPHLLLEVFKFINRPRFIPNLKRMLPTTSEGGRDCCTDCGTRNGDRNVKNDLTEESDSAVVEEGEDGFSFTWKSNHVSPFKSLESHPFNFDEPDRIRKTVLR